MRKKGQIKSTHPVFNEIKELKNNSELLTKPASSYSYIRTFIDGRLLHRNTIYQK